METDPLFFLWFWTVAFCINSFMLYLLGQAEKEESTAEFADFYSRSLTSLIWLGFLVPLLGYLSVPSDDGRGADEANRWAVGIMSGVSLNLFFFIFLRELFSLKKAVVRWYSLFRSLSR